MICSTELKDFEIKMVYQHGKFDIPFLEVLTYDDAFFEKALDLESDLFYEFRKKNNFLPHKINQSSVEEKKDIKAFFNTYKKTFYFYFDGDELVANILMKDNFIQSLSVARKY